MTRATAPMSSRLWERRPKIRRWIGGLLMFAAIPGCSRQFWRNQADMDVYDNVTAKLVDPRWAVPRIDVAADPRSRFYDPYDLDRPPLPPDDPTAHAFMHWVDGWQGYKGWHQFGDSLSVENPQWLANLGLEAGSIDPVNGESSQQQAHIDSLTLQQAVELSLIHSRDYQTQIENVYLGALDVTFERFQFGVRYLGTNGEPGAGLTTAIAPDGVDINDGATGTSSFGISQVVPTGAQWMVELTNNTLWLFSGPNQTNTASILSYSLTQPLWNGAGRKVILESLTLAERQLLYAIRDLSRFRQQLFTDVVATSSSTSYLGLLQSLQQILNQRANLVRQQQQVLKLTAVAARGKELPSAPLLNPDGSLVDVADAPAIQIPPELEDLLFYSGESRRLRWRPATEMTEEQATLVLGISDAPSYQSAATDLIRQVRVPVTSLDVLAILSSYNNSLSQLRNSERNFQDSLDAYKIQLGLPPTLPIRLDETLLKQFELIDPVLTDLEQAVDLDFSETWARSAPPDVGIFDPDAAEPFIDPALVKNVADDFAILVSRVGGSAIDLIRGEVAEVSRIVPQRIVKMEPNDRDRLVLDFDRDQRSFASLEERFLALQERVAGIETDLAAPRIAQETVSGRRTDIKSEQEELTRIVRGLMVLEVGLRTEMIEVADFDMTQDECLSLALDNRVDLMNARAQVMDSRRLVEIAANRLQAALSLVAQGSFGTTNRTNPFSFNGDNSQIRFGVQFKAPLDQITERNNYRTALINYQRQKRSYMLFEDGVKQQVRRALRGLSVQKRNLETSRSAIRRAAQQYDAQNEQSDDPARANQAANATGTAGVQGNNVIQALSNILNSQNQLVSTWIDYERNRLNIYRDMGIMDIGPDGLWNDSFYRNEHNERSPSVDEIAVPPLPAAGGHSDPDGGGVGGGV